MKREISFVPIAAVALLLVALVGYFLLVKPKQAESGRLDTTIEELENQLEASAPAEPAPAPTAPTAIKVTDIFRLTTAMPDEEDMAGIILGLNSVASAAGIEFVAIVPQAPVVKTGYSAIPVNLEFEGNYYDLTDFLFRLRNLVSVRDGELTAEGRLFTLDTLDMQEGPAGFPEIKAALTLSAFLYGTTPPAGAPTAPTETTTTTSTETTATTTSETPIEGTP